ncbi:MAG: twin-arginine translocase subunit TatC [Fimbriimonadales bacterium]
MAIAPDNTEPWNDPEDPESHRATLVEHLDELRARIMRSLLVLAMGWAAGWFLEPYIYENLNAIVRDPSLWPAGVVGKEAFTNFSDPFFLKFKLSFIIGLVLAAPVIIVQLWGFVRPALKPNERKPLRIVAPLSAVLFLVGTFFGYLILRPAFAWFLSFLDDFQGTELLQNPGSYVIFIMKMLFAFGLGFQLPLVLWFFGSVGIITADALWKNWRMAVGGIAALSAFLTPGGDFFSFIAMAVPLTLLYFASISAIRVTEKRRVKRERADAAE